MPFQISTQFPGWAPSSVIDLWSEQVDQEEYQIAVRATRLFKRRERGHPAWQLADDDILQRAERDGAAMLFRLLTDPRMERVWYSLQKGLGYESGSQDGVEADSPEEVGCRRFAATALRHWPRPEYRDETLPSNPFMNWVAEVERKAAELSQLLVDTRMDQSLDRASELKTLVRQDDPHHPCPIPLDGLEAPIDPFTLSELLAWLAEAVAGLEPPPDRPNRESSRRIPFIRALTEVCLHHFREPRRALVAITASVAFQTDIDRRAVIRTAPTSLWGLDLD